MTKRNTDAAAKTGGPFPTVAEAIARLETTADFPLRIRRNLIAALRVLVRIYGAPAETIRLDPAEIGPRLKSASPAVHGVKPTTFNTYKVAIGTVLRWLGLIDLPRRSKAKLSPAWAALRDALPDRFISACLQSFFAFCDARGLDPNAVNDTVLVAFGTALKMRRLTRNPTDQVRRVATAWNRARIQIPGWPQIELRPPQRTDRYSPPFSAYPASLQADLETFRKAAGHNESDSLYPEEGQQIGLRETSLETHLKGLRLALAALVLTGRPIENITGFDVMLAPANIKRIIDFHWLRAGRKKTRNTGNIANAISVVARTRFKEGSEELREIRALLKRARPPKQTRMTPKNERQLAQFDDPMKRACLLHLPGELFRKAEARKAAGHHRAAAWTAATAVAVAIELRCPMRIRTLTRLRIGQELVRLDGRRKLWTHYMVEPEDTKTGEPLRWPVAESTSVLIDRYIDEFRPALQPGNSNWLFPSRDHPTKPRSEAHFSQAIGNAIWRNIGADMTAHLFRAFAGALILEDNPAAFEDLRLLLGHTTFDTALRHYRSHQPKAAAERINRLQERRMAESLPLAEVAFAKMHGGQRAKGTPARHAGGAS